MRYMMNACLEYMDYDLCHRIMWRDDNPEHVGLCELKYDECIYVKYVLPCMPQNYVKGLNPEHVGLYDECIMYATELCGGIRISSMLAYIMNVFMYATELCGGIRISSMLAYIN